MNRRLWPGCSDQCLEGPLAEGVMLHNCCLKFLRISSLQLCFVCEGQEDNGARAKGLEHIAVSKPPGMTSQSAPTPSASDVTPPQPRQPQPAPSTPGTEGALIHIGPHPARVWTQSWARTGKHPTAPGKAAAIPACPGLPGSRRGPQSTPWWGCVGGGSCPSPREGLILPQTHPA